MKKIKLKIKNSGFVLLFAVTLAAILLSIALGVSNVALKEIKFGTSAKDTNEAFFAADTGAECALINDKSTANVFKDGGSSQINCNNSPISVLGGSGAWSFDVVGLGINESACAKVSLTRKTDSNNIPFTEVIAKGYNNNAGDPGICRPSPSAVERQLEVTY